MMNKQMSEDCARQHMQTNRPGLLDHFRRPSASSSGHHDDGQNTRSLQKLTDSCEMKDLTGRSIYETKRFRVRKQLSVQSTDAV